MPVSRLQGAPLTQKILIIQIDEENDRRNVVTFHETNRSLYNETNLYQLSLKNISQKLHLKT